MQAVPKLWHMVDTKVIYSDLQFISPAFTTTFEWHLLITPNVFTQKNRVYIKTQQKHNFTLTMLRYI